MGGRSGGVTRAVCFDLDGTLLDTIDDLFDACGLMLDELGAPSRGPDEIRRFVGKGIPNLVWRCLGEPDDRGRLQEAEAVFRRHYAQINGRRTRIYPGVLDTLEALRARGLALCCVTNKAAAFSEPLIAQMGLAPYLPLVISGDTLPVKKPDPAVLHHACARLAVRPEEALMVGDSLNDALAARAAGMPVLLVDYGYAEGMAVDTIDCDGLVSSMTEIMTRLA